MKFMIKRFFILLSLTWISCQSPDGQSQLPTEEETVTVPAFDTVYRHKEGNELEVQYFQNGILYSTKTMIINKWEKIDSTNGQRTVSWFEKGNIEEGPFKVYNAEGKLLEEGTKGSFNGCWMLVGEYKSYSDGILTSAIGIHHAHDKEDEGCHGTWHRYDIVQYFPNGNRKFEKFLESCYECESCPCGEWKEFDEQDTVIRTISYGDCDDQEMDCGHLEDPFSTGKEDLYNVDHLPF